MYPLFILLLYYWLIIFSIVGYGFFFQKFLIKDNSVDIGYIGIFGIFLLILISYISNFFIAHNQIFNSIIIISGLINFYWNRNNDLIKKKYKIIYYYLFSINHIYFDSQES